MFVNGCDGGGPDVCTGCGVSDGFLGFLPNFGRCSSITLSDSLTAFRFPQKRSSVRVDPSAYVPTFILTVDRESLFMILNGPK